jgi:Dehydrogenases with different specificities (related to short-chain alcohol dehydrogenases)
MKIMRLKDKVALVTGGSRGIGAEIVKTFSKEGATVYLNYNNNESKARSISEIYNNVKLIKADVSQREQVSKMIEYIKEDIGFLDILVNNAGIMLNMPILEYDEAKVRKMFDVNLFGTIYTTIESAKIMREGSSIINIASNAGIGTSFMNTTYYSLTKAAVINFTKRVALELANIKIRCNAIAPGWIETDLTIGARSREETEQLKKFLVENTTIGRWGSVEDVAKVALFLATEDSGYVNGQVIVVDGGRKDYLTHSI